MEYTDVKPKQYVVAPELFAVRDEARHIIYLPLKGTIVATNQAAVNWLAAQIDQPPITPTTPFHHQLVALGVLEEEGETTIPDLAVNGDFRPTDVIILATSSCNFRCVYCYATAGTRQLRVDPFAAQAAIRLIIHNAAEQCVDTVNLAFHGGGEPTLVFDFLQGCMEYAERCAKDRGIKVHGSLVTNGYLAPDQVDWLARHMHSIQVSFDGYAEIQNEQRPLASNGHTYERVFETIRRLEASQVNDLLIKATITNRHVQDMPSIARFFCQHFGLKRFHFGPVLEAGRSITTGYVQPSALEFVDYAEEAQRIAKEYGRSIVVSLAQETFPRLRSAFCGLTDPNFAISAEGQVTSCYEVIYKDDPRSPRFHYGRYLPLEDRYEFDHTRIEAIRGRLGPNLARCARCFIRWQCAGDCQMRFYSEQDGAEAPDLMDFRCELNRELVRRQIIRTLGREGHVRIQPSFASEKGSV